MCLTGDDTTITVTADDGGMVGRVVSISEWTEEVDVIKDNDLSLQPGDHEKHCIGKLIKHDRVEGIAVFDPDTKPDLGNYNTGITATGSQGTDDGTVATITITFQTPPGRSAGATKVGAGWLTQRPGIGNLENGVRSEGAFSFVFSGTGSGIVDTSSTA